MASNKIIENMKVIKMKRKTQNKVELSTLIVKLYCTVSDIRINETDKTVLAYFMVYGIKKSTKELIIKSLILGTYNSLENSVTRLRKAGLIYKDEEGFNKICTQLCQINSLETKAGVIIELSHD